MKTKLNHAEHHQLCNSFLIPTLLNTKIQLQEDVVEIQMTHLALPPKLKRKCIFKICWIQPSMKSNLPNKMMRVLDNFFHSSKDGSASS